MQARNKDGGVVSLTSISSLSTGICRSDQKHENDVNPDTDINGV